MLECYMNPTYIFSEGPLSSPRAGKTMQRNQPSSQPWPPTAHPPHTDNEGGELEEGYYDGQHLPIFYCQMVAHELCRRGCVESWLPSAASSCTWPLRFMPPSNSSLYTTCETTCTVNWWALSPWNAASRQPGFRRPLCLLSTHRSRSTSTSQRFHAHTAAGTCNIFL